MASKAKQSREISARIVTQSNRSAAINGYNFTALTTDVLAAGDREVEETRPFL
jgi:hypothetical protein